MILSILIPTTTKRAELYFGPMVDTLNAQVEQTGRKDIEILGLLDNYKYSIGEKRNTLLNMAKGKFLVFIDDDDRVSDDFISSIISEINKHPDADCICYEMLCTINGARQIHSRFGIEYEYTKMAPWSDKNCNIKSITPEEWFGKPSHNMVWASSLAKQQKFPHTNAGEDFDWVARTWPKIKKQVKIDKIIYYYDCVLGKDY